MGFCSLLEFHVRDILSSCLTLDVAQPNKKENQDENEDSENEGCSIMEREKVTASEATAAVRLLRNFVVSSDTAGAREKEILRYLRIVEDTFLAINVAGRKRQSKLEDFFWSETWNFVCVETNRGDDH